MALLEVENLSIGYHTRRGFLHAVEGVSFSLAEGQSLGFVGESGCGKTTLGMAIMGLLPPNAADPLRAGSLSTARTWCRRATRRCGRSAGRRSP